MASARDIKRRIKSVKSTQQITKAMKMISAAKLRKAQSSVIAVRPYANKIGAVIANLASGNVEHPLLKKKEVKRVGFVVIAGDGGLCGGFNGNILRLAEHAIADCTYPVGLITIGSKAREYFRRRKWPIDQEFTDLGDNPGYIQGKEIAKYISNLYLENQYDEVHLFYTEFKSAMSQRPTSMQLLPMQKPSIEETGPISAEYIFEPNGEEILDVVVPQYVEVSVYRALLESKASEHGARMTAMSSATDNALEMIDKLTLSLNRARQAAITTEISEIVGGAAALS